MLCLRTQVRSRPFRYRRLLSGNPKYTYVHRIDGTLFCSRKSPPRRKRTYGVWTQTAVSKTRYFPLPSFFSIPSFYPLQSFVSDSTSITSLLGSLFLLKV